MSEIILATLLLFHVVFANLALHEKRKEIKRLKVLIAKEGE